MDGNLLAIIIVVWFFLSIIIALDAETRDMNGWLWGFIVFAAGILGLIVYAIVKKPKMK